MADNGGGIEKSCNEIIENHSANRHSFIERSLHSASKY